MSVSENVKQMQNESFFSFAHVLLQFLLVQNQNCSFEKRHLEIKSRNSFVNMTSASASDSDGDEVIFMLHTYLSFS